MKKINLKNILKKTFKSKKNNKKNKVKIAKKKKVKKTSSSEWWKNLKYIEEINRGEKK